MNNFFSNNRTNLPHFTGYAMHKMGCSRKNPKKGGGGLIEDILFWKTPGIFQFFTLPLEIPDKTKSKLTPWIFHKIMLDPLRNFQPKGHFISLTPPRPLLLDHFFWNSPRGPIPTSWIENCPERQEERNF